MPKLSHVCLIAGLAVPALATPAFAADAPKEGAMSQHSVAADPYQWLENVTDDKALTWVKAENAKIGRASCRERVLCVV